MKTLRDRIQELTLEYPAEFVLETAAEFFDQHGGKPLLSVAPLQDVAYIAAALVILSSDKSKASIPLRGPFARSRTFNITLDDHTGGFGDG